MTGQPSHRWKSRLGLKVVVVILLVFGVVGVSLLCSVGRQSTSSEFAGSTPHWIWDSAWPNNPVLAHAFAVEREIAVPAVPSTARMLIAADEEYHVYWNGEWVGSGAYQVGEWDAYEIASKAVVGSNRLRVELRSSRGVGGLLVCVQAAPGESCWLASDGDWQILPADGGPARPVDDWGAAPIGSLPLPTVVRDRHNIDQCLIRGVPVEARNSFALEDRVKLRRDREVTVPVHTVRWGPRALGLVEIDVDPADRRLGVLAYGRNRRIPAQRDFTETVITEAGQTNFRSVSARSMRFVEIDGIETILGGRYYPIDESCTDWVFAAPTATEGLFGLEPPPSRSPVENELWGKL